MHGAGVEVIVEKFKYILFLYRATKIVEDVVIRPTQCFTLVDMCVCSTTGFYKYLASNFFLPKVGLEAATHSRLFDSE